MQLEKRSPVESLLSRFKGLFQSDPSHPPHFTDEAFSFLLDFLTKGEPSYQNVAVQAAVRWAASSQRVMLRNAIVQRGFLTPSCLWAYRQVRGTQEELFRDYPSPEMGFLQILLLKETDPALSVPFLIERFLNCRDVSEELRAASRLCILRLLDSVVSPDVVRSLQAKYPGVQILRQWRPVIPGRGQEPSRGPSPGYIDFYQLVRSVHDMKELSSLTRTVYLVSLFYVPLTDKEWRALWLSQTDQAFFDRLRLARMVDTANGGLLLSTDPSRQAVVKKFLYESYSLAKESVRRRKAERVREDRERKVRNSELDRQALEMVPDGIICVDCTGLLYYMNRAAEAMLNENRPLRERLFGTGSLEDALRSYSREGVLSRIKASIRGDEDSAEIFGDRVVIGCGGKRFEVELGAQVLLLRDTTDQHLIDNEIGRLYRHELKAALDVMGVGLGTVKQLIGEGQTVEGVDFLEQVEAKRVELVSMLEERIDFIRLHSDSFHIRPSTVNLNLVVDKCVTDYRDAAGAKGVRISSNHLHTTAIQVTGEERFLVRALANILRNALKFSPKGKEIKVSIGDANLEAFIRVEDRGPGIPPENLGKIFQLGFTTGGTGRGLYLARRIASAHGGRIDVKSKPDNGATFTFWLPLLRES
ncbi:MAG: PAS domain-containing sensor histidine kinase [Desulfomonilaceae bacterium]